MEREAAQRELLVEYLGRHNLRVSSTADGVELRRLIEHNRPAAVLLDIGLSGENGLALARSLRRGLAPAVV